jgi:hypothetical protein
MHEPPRRPGLRHGMMNAGIDLTHVAFGVDDPASALEGQEVPIQPNSPSEGVTVAFVVCKSGKFWLNPVRIRKSGGFARIEIYRIAKLVEVFQIDFLEAWNEYFGN